MKQSLRDILIEKNDAKARSIRPNSVFMECLEEKDFYCCFSNWTGIQKETFHNGYNDLYGSRYAFREIDFVLFDTKMLSDSVFLGKIFSGAHDKMSWKFSILDENRNIVQSGILGGLLFTSYGYSDYDRNSYTVTANFDTLTFGQAH